jgi:hypothetical protein
MPAAALREHAGAIAPRNVEDRRDGASPATNKGEHMTMPNERLRASKYKALQCEFSAGKREGRTWARKAANYGQLVRMSRFHSTIENNRSVESARAQANKIREALVPETANEASLADDTERVTAFLGGFMEGVVEFFEEVKVHI